MSEIVYAPNPGEQPNPRRAREREGRVVAPDPTPAEAPAAPRMPTRAEADAPVERHRRLRDDQHGHFERLNAERLAHAEERAAHDLARKMMREQGTEVLGLRDQLAAALDERDKFEAAAAAFEATTNTLEARLAATATERDTLKQLADSLEAQLTAPVEPPAPAPADPPPADEAPASKPRRAR